MGATVVLAMRRGTWPADAVRALGLGEHVLGRSVLGGCIPCFRIGKTCPRNVCARWMDSVL